MVSNPEAAKKISDLMVKIEHELAASMQFVGECCTAEELEAYKKAVGKIVSAIVFDVIEPLYERHPELKPAGWDE